jgi:hypothetical protein
MIKKPWFTVLLLNNSLLIVITRRGPMLHRVSIFLPKKQCLGVASAFQRNKKRPMTQVIALKGYNKLVLF